MSEIKFSAELETSKLDAAVKQSNKTIGDWSKGIEKAGAQTDQGLAKMTKSFKDAIREQKQLIKDIEADVKKLQKTYDDATAGRAKQAAGFELRAAKKVLAEEQAVLIGLQKQQIDANNEENSTISKLVGGLGKWVIGLASVGTALKIAKSIINSTESASRKFDEAIAGATAGTQYFFKTLASGDWSNFFGNMGRAIKGAVEFVDTMERLANRQNEQKIKSSEYDIKIAELRDATYDKDEENNEARKKALEEIIALQKQKYEEEAKLAKELYDANLKKAASDSGLSEQQIKEFIKQYSSFERLIEIGEKYNELQKLMYSPGATNRFLNELQKQVDALGPGAEEAGKYVKEISKVTPEIRKQLADYAAAANEAEAAYGQKNRRDKMQLAEVANKIKAAEEETKRKAEEDARLENKIKVQQELLAKAIEAGNAAEIKAIGAKIAELQKELAVRQRIAELAIGTAIVREAPITNIKGLQVQPLLPGGIKAPDTLAGQPVYDSGDYIQGTKMLSDAGKAKQKKRDAEYDRKAEEAARKQIELRNQIVQSAADLVYQLGLQIGLDEQSSELLGATLDSFTRLAAGDVVGAATSMISGLIQMIPNETRKFEEQIEHINLLIKEQQGLIEKSERTGGEASQRQKELDLLNKQKDEIEKQIERDEKKMKSWIDLFGSKERAQADYFTQIEALKTIKESIDEAEQSLNDFLVGGVTQNTIADVIAQGFQEGKTSVDDFASYMNDVLVDAVLNIFKSEILGPQIDDITKYTKEALSDKILSPEEKENIDRMTKEAADANKQLWDNLTGSLDITGAQQQRGLSGAISRQITEDTGSELAGLFRRFADDERVVKDYSVMGVAHLVGIEKNTAETVTQLQLAVTELKNIVSNTKQVPTAAL